MKNVLIGILIFSNLVTAAYFGYSEYQSRKRQAPAKKAIAKVEGPSDIRGHISGAIRARTTKLQKCYNQYLATTPDARGFGSLQLGWIIDSNGKVENLELKASDFEDQRLSDCVLDQVRQWTFNQPSEPINIAHRFTFQQRQSGEMNF